MLILKYNHPQICHFQIGKTASANILKEEKSIRSQYEYLSYENR